MAAMRRWFLSEAQHTCGDVSALISLPGAKAAARAGASSSPDSPRISVALTVSAAAGADLAAADRSEVLRLLQEHPQLSDEDKHAALFVLAQSPRYEWLANMPGLDLQGLPQWEHYMHMLGISASRQKPVPPERAYKLRGITVIDATPQVVYELLSNEQLMKQWDPMRKESVVLQRASGCQFPLLNAGYDMGVYGVPGFSMMVNDSHFLLRLMALELPDGTRVIVAYSPAADSGSSSSSDSTSDTSLQRSASSCSSSSSGSLSSLCSACSSCSSVTCAPPSPPAPGPRSVRGHMGISGFVISPLRQPGVGRQEPVERCEVSMLLQVDPKSGVPMPVINFLSMTMPMALHRVKGVLAKLGPAELEVLQAQQDQALEHALAAAAAAAAGGGCCRCRGGSVDV